MKFAINALSAFNIALCIYAIFKGECNYVLGTIAIVINFANIMKINTPKP